MIKIYEDNKIKVGVFGDSPGRFSEKEVRQNI